MRYRSKQGFSLAEALVGFSLFSVLLMLYLPAFYTEMARMTLLKTETEQWRIFYELVQEANQPMPPYSTDIEDFDIYHNIVESFHCEPAECSIFFTDGSVYYVTLQEIN